MESIIKAHIRALVSSIDWLLKKAIRAVFNSLLSLIVKERSDRFGQIKNI